MALKDTRDSAQQTVQSEWAKATAMEDKEGLSGQAAGAGSPGRAERWPGVRLRPPTPPAQPVRMYSTVPMRRVFTLPPPPSAAQGPEQTWEPAPRTPGGKWRAGRGQMTAGGQREGPLQALGANCTQSESPELGQGQVGGCGAPGRR